MTSVVEVPQAAVVTSIFARSMKSIGTIASLGSVPVVINTQALTMQSEVSDCGEVIEPGGNIGASV